METTDASTKPAADGAKPTGEPDKPTGPPDEYKFTPPEGTTYDDKLIAAATPIFRELGLSQAAADKLVTMHNTEMARIAKEGLDTRAAMIERWNAETKADPDMGGKLDKVKADLGRFKDVMFAGDLKARTAFEEAVDLTGAGHHPAIIKGLWLAAQKVIEGRPVNTNGTGPSERGQNPEGTSTKPTPAQLMYPNLPSINTTRN